MLKHRVFADKITSLADARYFAANGADWLSFLITPDQPESISEQELKEIKSWLSGPEIVGRFIQPSASEIEHAIEHMGLGAVYVDASTPLIEIQQGFTVPIYKEINMEEQNWAMALEWAVPFVDSIILTSNRALSIQEQELVEELCAKYDIFLDINLAGEWDENHQFTAQTSFTPMAYFVTAAEKEKEIGKKTFEQLDSFFDFLADED